jgi:hypothetical protein
MYNLKRSKTITGVPGLLVVALLVVGCRDSVGPGHRVAGGPEAWLIEPPPPPPTPPPPPPHLEFTQQPNDAVAAAACVQVPDLTTITAVVTVKNAAGVTVDFNGDVTIRIGHDGALSPPGHLCDGMTATDHITLPASGGVRTFTFAIDRPSSVSSVIPGDTYTIVATATVDGVDLSVTSSGFTVTVII